MPAITRRDLFAMAGGLPLVFGLPGVLLQEASGSGEPAWLGAARQRMRELGAPAIAVVVPPTGKEIAAGDRRRAELGRRLVERIDAVRTANGEKVGKSFSIEVTFVSEAELVAACLQSLLLSPSTDVQELFLLAVWLCAPAAVVRAGEGETLVLLDQGGERLAGSKVDLSDEKAVVAAVRELMRGPGRLAARAERANRKVVAALPDVTHADAALREAARRTLVLACPQGAPAIVQARWTSDTSERSEALAAVVTAAFAAAAGKDKLSSLPFGVAVAAVAYDPCPPCGMAMVPDASRKLLRFLAR